MPERIYYGIIYCYTNKINGKQYVGYTKHPKKRKKRHNSDALYGSQSIFHVALRKYGIENFDYSILETCEISLLKKREIHWIKILHTFLGDPQCNGYNMTTGGDGGECSEETRKLISEKNTGRKKSKESCTKQSKAMLGSQNHFFGKHHTEEAKQKMRGKRLPFSKQSCLNMAKSREKTYEITFPNGSIQIIKGLKSFCDDHHLTATRMFNVAQGKSSQHKGYKCRKVT